MNSPKFVIDEDAQSVLDSISSQVTLRCNPQDFPKAKNKTPCTTPKTGQIRSFKAIHTYIEHMKEWHNIAIKTDSNAMEVDEPKPKITSKSKVAAKPKVAEIEDFNDDEDLSDADEDDEAVSAVKHSARIKAALDLIKAEKAKKLAAKNKAAADKAAEDKAAADATASNSMTVDPTEKPPKKKTTAKEDADKDAAAKKAAAAVKKSYSGSKKPAPKKAKKATAALEDLSDDDVEYLSDEMEDLGI